MSLRTNKTPEKENKPLANQRPESQKNSNTAYQLVDKRPEAVAQRKLQELANNSPRTKKVAQLQAIANHYSIQKKANQQSRSGEVVQLGKKKAEDDSEYSEDSDDGIPAEEIYHDPKGPTYRSPRFFYNDKKVDTRADLVARQTDEHGMLRSGFDGTGEVIPLDGSGREIRDHKTKGAKNQQPDIDHKIDFVAVDDAIDHYEESDMSEDEKEEFKNYTYNRQDNLEILSHGAHTGKRRTTRDQISSALSSRAKQHVKVARVDFKNNADAQRRRRERKHRRLRREAKNK